MRSDNEKPEKVEPIWAIHARVIGERPYGPKGQTTKRGIRKFNANQKVYLQNAYWGMGAVTVTMIGRYRGKHNYISCDVRTAYLTNFRARLVYSPTVIERIQYGYSPKPYMPLTQEDIETCRLPMDGSSESKQKAQELAEFLNTIAEAEREKIYRKIQNHHDEDTPSDG